MSPAPGAGRGGRPAQGASETKRLGEELREAKAVFGGLDTPLSLLGGFAAWREIYLQFYICKIWPVVQNYGKLVMQVAD